MTEPLCRQNPQLSRFTARVTARERENNLWKITLDQTAFYPEGGGQPADHGHIAGIPVVDVRKDKTGGQIVHYLTADPGTGEITGEVDMTRRHDYMQQHTGQHILSGALFQTGGYTTLSVHMGPETTTIELDAPSIPPETVQQAEDLANETIRRALPIDIIYAAPDQLHLYPARKKPDREGPVRLVRIGDFDCVACGGLHGSNTRFVEYVKACGSEKIRGNTRLAWKIGRRAFADYALKDRIAAELKQMLGAGDANLVQKVGDLREELLQTVRRANSLESRLAELLAASLAQTAENGVIAAELTDADDPETVKKVMKLLIQREQTVICLLHRRPGRLQWSIGCTPGLDLPFREIQAELLPLINGKGGGRSPLWQGSGDPGAPADEFLRRFRALPFAARGASQ